MNNNHTLTIVSNLPDCQFHWANEEKRVPAAVDGKTIYGPWAYMCQSCFIHYGIGLGLGRGQKLEVG